MNPQTIPGTDFPFQVYERKGPPVLKNAFEAKQRKGLLAKIHVAKKQMNLNQGEYDMILNSLKASSAADLSIPDLEKMIKLMKHFGWKPAKRYRPDDATKDSTEFIVDQALLAALRERAVEISEEINNGQKRLAGLALKICGTSQLAWCRDAEKLERLLAVLGKIKEGE